MRKKKKDTVVEEVTMKAFDHAAETDVTVTVIRYEDGDVMLKQDGAENLVFVPHTMVDTLRRVLG